jgi:multiple antibiotic resistance protein
MDFNALSFRDIATITLVLFAVIDVLGTIPVLVDLKAKTGHINARQATLVSGGIMISFLFVGDVILRMIGLDVASFSLAGSVVIFLVGLEMVLGRDIFQTSPQGLQSSSIVPIAFPLIAGAGTLTTILSLRAEYNPSNILVSIFINLVIVYLVLRFIPRIEKLLGDTGIHILRRVFGIVLLAIAFKLFTKNVGVLLNV